MLNYEMLDNGNLKISGDSEGLQEVAELWERFTGGNIDYIDCCMQIVEKMDGLTGELQLIPAEWVGALTDSPIIAASSGIELSPDCSQYDEECPAVSGPVWWFPDYQIMEWIEELIYSGSVIFTRGGVINPTI